MYSYRAQPHQIYTPKFRYEILTYCADFRSRSTLQAPCWRTPSCPPACWYCGTSRTRRIWSSCCRRASGRRADRRQRRRRGTVRWLTARSSGPISLRPRWTRSRRPSRSSPPPATGSASRWETWSRVSSAPTGTHSLPVAPFSRRAVTLFEEIPTRRGKRDFPRSLLCAVLNFLLAILLVSRSTV